MNNNSKTLNQTKTELLQEFKKVARGLGPQPGLVELRCSLSMWVSLNMTVLLQRLAYNKKRIAAFKNQNLILNIGCGDFIGNGYVNTDLFPTVGNVWRILFGKKKLDYDLFLDLTYHDPHLVNCANGIVLSHTLEHIPAKQVIAALRNCFDYLKQDGCIRVSVPYLGAYNRPDFPPYQMLENRTLAINNLIYGHQHQFMYDSELLILLLEEAGFSDVREVAFGEGLLHETDHPDRQLESIYLTGVKA